MHTPVQKPVRIPIAATLRHSPIYTTLFFDVSLTCRPGQFLMVWLPGVDEKPYTVSWLNETRFGITIEAKGIFSRKAAALEPGEPVWIRGPFGRGFDILPSPHVAVVAGGCGMAPLAPLLERLHPDAFFVQGARTRESLLYPDRFAIPRHVATDDGSLGHEGFVTDLLAQEITARKTDGRPLFDRVYTCGPEPMMHTVFTLCEAHGMDCQVSLERYMRCGFGVCGACVCGDRVICTDGPVLSSADLRTLTAFNRTALLKSGLSVPLAEYVSWRCP